MKRIIYFATFLIMFVGVATAQEKFKLINAEGCTIKYRVIDSEGKKVEVAKAKGKKEVDLVIPEIVSYNGTEYTVEGLGKNSCRDVKSGNIILPNTIKYIGYRAFLFNYHTHNVYLPEGLEVIDDQAFCNTLALLSINIPSTVQYIGKYAFINNDWSPKQCIIGNLPPIVTSDNCEYCGLSSASVMSYYTKNPDKLNETIYYNVVSKYIPSEDEIKRREKAQNRLKNFCAVMAFGLPLLNEYIQSMGETSVPTSVGGMNNTSYSQTSASSSTPKSNNTVPNNAESTHGGSITNTRKPKMCKICYGSGKCSNCNGKGWYTRMGLGGGKGKEKAACPVCINHDGKCQWCHGTGEQ